MAIRKSSSSGIPFGNTASRPANPGLGQLYSNGQTARLELYTATGWQNIIQETPGVAGATGTYNESTGSGTFTISGTNFVDGAIAYAIGTNGTEYQATSTTYNSLVQLTTVFSNLSAAYEPYDIKITNPSNLFGLLPDAFYINDSPVWSTTAGSLGTYTGSSIQLATTDDESNTITYSITSGSLPTGVSLSSSGLISGTATGNPGTYTFTVSASDGSNTAVTRSFSLVVYPTITGGTVAVSGDYRIHTFTSSGTFATNASSLNVDYLVVAGGGGGGTTYGGGGGAGGLRSTVTATGRGGTLESQLTLSSNNNYTVTVGGGGATGLAGYNPTNAPGFNGNNSVFSTITALGGGGGGGGGGSSKNGGSGGGGMDSLTPGSGTTGQGFDGGGSASGGNYGAGGGGGAGSNGVSGNSGAGGNGGSGVAVTISGSSVTYAGGGGGGTYTGGTSGSGGSGGGGNAGAAGVTNAGSGFSGTANSGGGGGGSSALQAGSQYLGVGGIGGSGIVIVRYLKSVVGL